VPATSWVGRGGRHAALIVALYIGLIAFAEFCVIFVSPIVGAAAYAVTLVAMLTHVVVTQVPGSASGTSGRRLGVADALAALSFLPVLRLVSMSASVGADSTAGRYLLVAAIVLTAIPWAIWGVRLPGACLRPRAPTDREKDFVEFGVALLAVPVAVAVYFATRPALVAEGDGGRKVATAAIAVILLAIVEETIFRGFIQAGFVRVYGSLSGPLFAAMVYVILYIGVRPPEMIAYAAFLGLLLGWLVHRSGSLAAPILGHSLANLALFVVLPYLASSPTA
jgi:membrane protease YdiL (CAAX protease family)